MLTNERWGRESWRIDRVDGWMEWGGQTSRGQKRTNEPRLSEDETKTKMTRTSATTKCAVLGLSPATREASLELTESSYINEHVLLLLLYP